MKILSHRGLWRRSKDQNSLRALRQAFEAGFGIETDIRDFNESLIISHDPTCEKSMALETLFREYTKGGHGVPLALNLKSCGLKPELKRLIGKYSIKNYFLFDAVVPDALSYVKSKMRVFTRQSEYETLPSFYAEASGVWLDEFHSHWIDKKIIYRHFSNGKRVCLVSPELHGRRVVNEWKDYKAIEKQAGFEELMICTDFPERAEAFFNEK